MSNYFYAGDGGTDILELFDHNGNNITDVGHGDSYDDVEQTPDGYVYTVASNIFRQYSQNTDGTLTENWNITNNVFDNEITFAEGGDIIGLVYNGSENYAITRRSKTDGSVVWSSSYTQTPWDITRLDNGNVASIFDNRVIRELDADSGSLVNTFSVDVDSGISRDDNDNYVVFGSYEMIKYDRDGNKIWTTEFDSPSAADVQSLYRGYNKYYGFSTDNNRYEFYVVDDNGNRIWTETVDRLKGFKPYESNGSVKIGWGTSQYSNTNNATGQFDVETQSVDWSWEYMDGPSAISGGPKYEPFEEDWLPTVTLSGTVELQGGPIEGAEIIVIDDDANEIVDRVSSDSNGDWSTTVVEGTYHIISQYEDADGNTYNTESYPYVDATSSN